MISLCADGQYDSVATTSSGPAAAPVQVYSCLSWCYHPTEGYTNRFEAIVIHTDAPGTLAALRMAGGLAQHLSVHLRLVVPYEVPYALPIDRPAVCVDVLEAQVRGLADQAHLQVAGEIYLCRNIRQMLKHLLEPGSLLLLGGKKRWWPSAAQGLARHLEKNGHHVIFAALR